MGVLEPLLPALQLHPAEVVAATAVDLRLEAAVAVTKDHPAAAAAALHHHATLVVHLLVVSTKEEEEEEEEEVLEEATVDHLQHVSTCSCNPPPPPPRAFPVRLYSRRLPELRGYNRRTCTPHLCVSFFNRTFFSTCGRARLLIYFLLSNYASMPVDWFIQLHLLHYFVVGAAIFSRAAARSTYCSRAVHCQRRNCSPCIL